MQGIHQTTLARPVRRFPRSSKLYSLRNRVLPNNTVRHAFVYFAAYPAYLSRATKQTSGVQSACDRLMLRKNVSSSYVHACVFVLVFAGAAIPTS